jgi:hypothetical protein
MACGCATGSRNSNKMGKGAKQTPLDMYLEGSFIAGLEALFLSITKDIAIKKIKLPNIIVFAENPCVGIGEGIIIENKDLANCLTNFAADCYTVTTLPVQVGTDWEVQVDAAWGTTNTGVTEFIFQTTLGYEACGTSAPAKNLMVKICAGAQNEANWSGAVYTRPLNSRPISGAVNIATGSPYLQISGKKDFRPKVGDHVQLAGTAIVGANKAVVLGVYSDGQVLLDRDVTGISVAADPTGKICVRAIATSRIIANFVFRGKCKCGIRAILDKSITSSESFPPGLPVEGKECGAQKYCFTIIDSTPGAAEPVFAGMLELA